MTDDEQRQALASWLAMAAGLTLSMDADLNSQATCNAILYQAGWRTGSQRLSAIAMLEEVMATYARKVEATGATGCVYAWLDEQIFSVWCGFCSVSDPGRLPFGARLQFVDSAAALLSPRDVVPQACSSRYESRCWAA